MEISSQPVEDFLEVKAKGRLDGYWADHLTQALEEILRQGHDRIRMNLSEVSYVSSLGIRVLVVFYKKLSAINGAFVVSEPSLNARRRVRTDQRASPFATCPRSRNVLAYDPLPQILKEPKSLYQSPSGTCGCVSTQRRS